MPATKRARTSRGATGQRGIPGPPGPAGETGAKGPRGQTGLKGAEGRRGMTGSDGAIGPSGRVGSLVDVAKQMQYIDRSIENIYNEMGSHISRMTDLQKELDGLRETVRTLVARASTAQQTKSAKANKDRPL
jgi:hypothetical protein